MGCARAPQQAVGTVHRCLLAWLVAVRCLKLLYAFIRACLCVLSMADMHEPNLPPQNVTPLMEWYYYFQWYYFRFGNTI